MDSLPKDHPADRGQVAPPTNDDEPAFEQATEQHRRELLVHCYRMLGSLEDAEDRVQETMLRAWRQRASFEGRSGLRTWLYRIATNACIEVLRSRDRRPQGLDGQPANRPPSTSTTPWLQPLPDHLLDLPGPDSDHPEEIIVAQESVELAYLCLVQHLPARQRGVLILRDVHRFTAKETASILDTTVPAVNSALQRARETMRQFQPPGRSDRSTPPAPSADQSALLQRYIDAHEAADPAAVIALLREDARLTLCPAGTSWEGRDAITPSFMKNMNRYGRFRCIPTRANTQPAVAFYLRRWDDAAFRAFSIVVLSIEGAAITDITTFATPQLFPTFGLPAVRHTPDDPTPAPPLPPRRQVTQDTHGEGALEGLPRVFR
ncbi:MAG: RNA polymerase subunit sigma-70 [Acidimicrobiales bacterium]